MLIDLAFFLLLDTETICVAGHLLIKRAVNITISHLHRCECAITLHICILKVHAALYVDGRGAVINEFIPVLIRVNYLTF